MRAPSSPCRALAVAALLAFAPTAGCDLPQNSEPAEEDASGGGGTPGDNTFTVVYMLDGGEGLETATPGADLDALVAFRDGTFLFAGCTTATLFDADTVNTGGAEFSDPDAATLAVAEQSGVGGFVSLSAGTLQCQLPVALKSGDTLEIWEVGDDGDESWRVDFATSVAGEVTQGDDAQRGSVVLTVP